MRKGRKRILGILNGMKQRCYNSKDSRYPRYGGRGIMVCDEWRYNSQAFVDWSMSHGYADDLTIDRIDNDRNYCPENCRWATHKEQQNNRSNNVLITYNGETMDIKQWSEKLGRNYQTLFNRINIGWPVEKAFTEPVDTSLRNRYPEIPHVPGESKKDRDRKVKEYQRRQAGIRTDAERRADDREAMAQKAAVIRELRALQPGISVRKIAKATGIPKSTVQRLITDYSIDNLQSSV